MTETTQESRQRKGRRGCGGCIGCLAALAGVGVLVVALIWFAPWILRRIGISGPGAEELYAGAPDRVASEALDSSLRDAGITGVDALVISINGSEGQIAVLTLDTRATAASVSTQEEAKALFMEALRGLAEANQAGNLGIEEIAVDYRDESGNSLITVAAPQAAVEAYANGSITWKEFLAQVDLNFSNLMGAVELGELISEVP